MKILIIEDELPAADQLKNLIGKIMPQALVLGVCKTVKESVQWLLDNQAPDLILMDIELADGRSFKIFDRIKIKSQVIFITAYDAFAIKAIKLNALDYLLKPVNEEEMAAAIARVTERIENKHNNNNAFAELMDMVSNLNNANKPKKLAIGTVNGTIFVSIENIVRFEAESSYTTIYTSDDKKILASRILKDYEEMLADMGFYRVHNSHLVNLNYISKYIKGDGGTIVLANGTSIEVSRQKKKGLMDLLNI